MVLILAMPGWAVSSAIFSSLLRSINGRFTFLSCVQLLAMVSKQVLVSILSWFCNVPNSIEYHASPLATIKMDSIGSLSLGWISTRRCHSSDSAFVCRDRGSEYGWSDWLQVSFPLSISSWLTAMQLLSWFPLLHFVMVSKETASSALRIHLGIFSTGRSVRWLSRLCDRSYQDWILVPVATDLRCTFNCSLALRWFHSLAA